MNDIYRVREQSSPIGKNAMIQTAAQLLKEKKELSAYSYSVLVSSSGKYHLSLCTDFALNVIIKVHQLRFQLLPSWKSTSEVVGTLLCWNQMSPKVSISFFLFIIAHRL